MAVEESFSSLIERSIEQYPPLLIAKHCYEDAKLLRIMSAFLFPERKKDVLLLGRSLQSNEYYDNNEPDILLQFPCKRIEEYVNFFESFHVICPDDHPDFYHRSRMLKELKSVLFACELRLSDVYHYEELQTILGNIPGVPVRIVFLCLP